MCVDVCACTYIHMHVYVCIYNTYIQLHKHIRMYTHPHTHTRPAFPVCLLPDTSYMIFQKRKGQRTTLANYYAANATPVLLPMIMIRNQRTHFKFRSSILIIHTHAHTHTHTHTHTHSIISYIYTQLFIPSVLYRLYITYTQIDQLTGTQLHSYMCIVQHV